MRVLHVLGQRPLLTGSGVTLDALVRHAKAAGHEQAVVAGVPAGESPKVGGLPDDRIHPLHFERAPLDFPVVGMSDVMPYPSTRFRDLTETQLDTYRAAWRAHLTRVLESFEPDVIHSHHLWLLSSWIKDVAPRTPVLVHVHATGLRQLALAPHLGQEVLSRIHTCDRFLVLNQTLADEVEATLGNVPIDIVGTGYRDDLFYTEPGDKAATILYAGKLSYAKGVVPLIEAFAALSRDGVRLALAGGGAGEEAEHIRNLAERTDGVELLGRLSQTELAEVMRQSRVFVLPSFYEGVPLVLVEALASGCRLLASDLPGLAELSPHLGDALSTVPLPRLDAHYEPHAEDLPAFSRALTSALEAALDAPPPSGHDLVRFSWSGVFARVEAIWQRAYARG